MRKHTSKAQNEPISAPLSPASSGKRLSALMMSPVLSSVETTPASVRRSKAAISPSSRRRLASGVSRSMAPLRSWS